MSTLEAQHRAAVALHLNNAKASLDEAIAIIPNLLPIVQKDKERLLNLNKKLSLITTNYSIDAISKLELTYSTIVVLSFIKQESENKASFAYDGLTANIEQHLAKYPNSPITEKNLFNNLHRFRFVGPKLIKNIKAKLVQFNNNQNTL